MTKEQQFNASNWIDGLNLPFSTLSVSTQGNLIVLSSPYEQNPAALSIYDATGVLLSRIESPLIRGFCLGDSGVEKPNGNIIISTTRGASGSEVIEFDRTGKLIRQLDTLPSDAQPGVQSADQFGRLIIAVENKEFLLVDAELNALDFSGPNLCAERRTDQSIHGRLRQRNADHLPFYRRIEVTQDLNITLC